MKRVAVIGLGYVGLPLALLAEEKGFDVIGIDSSKKKLSKLKKRQPVIDDTIANRRLKKSGINFTDDFTLLKNIEIAIVCVPTPIDKNKNPDLTAVRSASATAAKNLKPGSLLIIESTINPGVCDEVVIPLIEKETDHVVGKSLYVAHCPERINPGDPKWHVGNINRVLGADSEKALDIAYEFYSNLIDAQIKRMGNIKEAEACKVVENSFRDINIAFVNELAMSFAKLGINVNNVIDGAATKPFAFMPHYPGIGVGGHCIPVDPYYLIEYAHNKGFEHDFLKLARAINDNMPLYVIDALEQAMIEAGEGDIAGKNIAVLGLSYKPNVGDDRESPAISVIKILESRDARVTTYDPYFIEESTSKTLQDAVNNNDAIIIVTAHKEFLGLSPSDLRQGTFLFDGRNALLSKQKDFLSSGVRYMSL